MVTCRDAPPLAEPRVRNLDPAIFSAQASGGSSWRPLPCSTRNFFQALPVGAQHFAVGPVDAHNHRSGVRGPRTLDLGGVGLEWGRMKPPATAHCGAARLRTRSVPAAWSAAVLWRKVAMRL